MPVPFYHCFGCVMGNLAALTHGAAVVVPAESFEPEATLRAIEAERCTSIYGVPTMFIAMLDHPAFAASGSTSLRTGIMAGAPCPIEVMRQVIDRMHVPEVTICYGMTETSPVSFQSAVDDALDVRVSTVGRVHPHVECKIVDPETGAIVPRGTPGELCTRGYSVMLGYWNNAEATAAAIDAARWMHTGDLAVMRDDGYVNISGRIKDMIIRGGENIYPREVEEFLYTHPKVSDVQVIGVPDAKYGEEVCAWIRLREGQSATVDELREFCRGQIASYKIPRYIRFTTRVPDDRHRQDSEVQDARNLDRRAGPGRRCARRDGVMKQGETMKAVRKVVVAAVMSMALVTSLKAGSPIAVVARSRARRSAGGHPEQGQPRHCRRLLLGYRGTVPTRARRDRGGVRLFGRLREKRELLPGVHGLIRTRRVGEGHL